MSYEDIFATAALKAGDSFELEDSF